MKYLSKTSLRLKIGDFCHIASVTAVLACVATMPTSTDAATVDIFLIADHTAPNASSEITTTKAYQLGNLNNSGRARQATLVDNFSFNIGTAMSFASLNDPSTAPSFVGDPLPFLTDQDEPGRFTPTTGDYVNSEISTWDNSGISGTTIEADEQLDFGRNSSVTFGGPAGGFTDLILADLGALNPLVLSFCPTVGCSSANRIFNGFSSGLTNTLLGLTEFAGADNVDGAMDQTWLFRFSETITDFVQITETGNRDVFTGGRLDADYIGAVGVNDNQISPIPGPTSLPLLASGFALMGWAMRRRKR
ncbi:hypothetical protein [uncultured Roseobacter sp.]|uniref:hypothetical protein n=1 Tax=uncultured Roseobacter sp. TaxID=114847 RepID=UPI00261EA51D|nr:hypothetical protein [uncultured Roseobacter sp.]